MSSSDLSRYSGQLLHPALLERSRRSPRDPLLFAQAYRRFRGQPMVIPPALEAPYRDSHPRVVIQKPAQVGVTEMNLNLGIWAASSGLGDRGNVLYLMPTSEQVERLSQARIAKALGESPELERMMTSASTGTQRVQLRSVADGVIYFAGADQTRQYLGIDADLVILDEFDLMKEEVLSNAIARLRSSRDPRLRVTSTPTIPEFGVNGLLSLSNDQHYELHCLVCDQWLEPEFPKNVDFDRGEVVCDCGSLLRHDQEGRWVARRPENRDFHGYQLNRLTLPRPPLDEMRLAAEGTIGVRQEEFWRQDLGVPFVTSDARLSAADLDRCRIDYPDAIFDDTGKRKRVIAGIDVGVHCFWVVIRMFWNERSYLIEAKRVEGDWEDLATFLRSGRMRVDFLVIDALPDTRGAKWLQREMAPTLTFICYYNRQTEHDYVWHRPMTINAARTLALDEAFNAFRRERSLLPPYARELADGQYYQHMQALVRTTEPDDFGQPIPAYRHSRPDDFAHAETYISLLLVRYGRPWGIWE